MATSFFCLTVGQSLVFYGVSALLPYDITASGRLQEMGVGAPSDHFGDLSSHVDHTCVL
ncbi:hypothetical protein DSUL_20172 [Desulfovibrionales bacterium]